MYRSLRLLRVSQVPWWQSVSYEGLLEALSTLTSLRHADFLPEGSFFFVNSEVSVAHRKRKGKPRARGLHSIRQHISWQAQGHMPQSLCLLVHPFAMVDVDS